MQFARLFPEEQIVATLSRQLWWSHFVEVLPLNDELQREFYLTFASNEHWGVRRLRKEIDGMLYERTAIATKPVELIKQELADLRDNDTMTELPPRDVLMRQIQKSLELAKSKWTKEI